MLWNHEFLRQRVDCNSTKYGGGWLAIFSLKLLVYEEYKTILRIIFSTINYGEKHNFLLIMMPQNCIIFLGLS